MTDVGQDSHSAEVEFRLLGDFEIRVNGVPATVPGANVRLVLAMLALQRGRVVPVDALGEELWGARPTVDVTGSVQALVSRARRALGGGPSILARSGGYLLPAEATTTDVDTFVEWTGRARAADAAGRPDEAAAAYWEALACWRGQALAGFGEREFARAEAARLEESRLVATEALADALLDARRPDEAAEVLAPHVAAHPFRESACGQLMLALYRSGRRADALATYRVVQAQIADELGLDPGPRLRRLEELVLAESPELDPPRAAPESPPKVTPRPPTPSAALPSAVGRFVGRDRELAELADLVRAERLITLWGPGGVGKTRLSLELASRSAGEFTDGLAFAALASLERSEQVPSAVLAVLGVLGTPGDPIPSLIHYLRGRQFLLVLDNCEHVLEGAAELVRALLTTCPGLCVLATSREPLALTAEYVWPAPSLSLPTGGSPADLAGSDAAALFIHRAHQASPSFEVTDANAPAVAEVCRGLDGIPLALELAAARVRALGVQGVAERLDDRLRLLVGGKRGADARHSTMRAAVDWSHELCSAGERELLACLSVFSGTFDAPAAVAVSGAAAAAADDALAGLVDRSLVVAIAAGDGTVRYSLLETIRAFAVDRLEAVGGTRDARNRHLAHFATTMLPGWDMWFIGGAGWPAIHAEAHNYRSAIKWALVERNATAALRLGARLWFYWASVHNPEDTPLEWLDELLRLPGTPDDRDFALALMAQAWHTSDPAPVYRAVALADGLDDVWLQMTVHWLAAGPVSQVDLAQARRHVETAVARAESGGYASALPNCLHRLAWIALAQGDAREARIHAENAVAALPAEPHPFACQTWGVLAVASAFCGADREAEAAAQRCLDLARESAFPGILCLALVRAATTSVFTRDWASAEQRLGELLSLLRELATLRWVGDVLQLTALTLEATGKPRPALMLFEASERYHRHHNETPAHAIPFITEAVAAARRRIGHKGDAGPPSAHSTGEALDEILCAAELALTQ